MCILGDKKKQPLSRKSSGGQKMALHRTRSLVPGGNLPSSLVQDTPKELRHSASDLRTLADALPRKIDIHEQEKEKLREYKKSLQQAELEEKKRLEKKKRQEDAQLFSGPNNSAKNSGSRSASPEKQHPIACGKTSSGAVLNKWPSYAGKEVVRRSRGE